MEARGLTFETMIRAEVKAFQASVTRRADPEQEVQVPAGLDPEGLVTVSEALSLEGMNASRSTLKRRITDGALKPAARPVTGHLYRIGDLFSEEVLRTSEGGLRRGPRRMESLSQEVVADIMWVFNEICLFAEDHGVDVPQDRKSLDLHRTDKAEKPKRQPVSLAQCGRIASRLHAVHQLVFWLMRVLGLRISEAYGIRVSDFQDNGSGRPGIVRVKAQGGRTFRTRDRQTGEKKVTGHVDGVKSASPYRVLVVPPMLMTLVRTVVEVFHTAPDGEVRRDARLVPGLKEVDAGGQGGLA